MKKEYWLLLLIVAIAAFFRLWDLPGTPPGLYPDEAMNGNNAMESLATNDWKVFYPENNGREGLFINIQSVSLAVFGNEPWALRLPSTIFGILTVIGIYFLTRELFSNSGTSDVPNLPAGRQVFTSMSRTSDVQTLKDSYIRNKFVFRSEHIALLAAFLLAVSFWHINFSRIGFRAIIAPAFLTWGVYLLLLSFHKITSNFRTSDVPKTGSSDDPNINVKLRSSDDHILKFVFRSGVIALLAGIIYGLGLHSYIAYRATPLLIFFIIAAHWFKNKDREFRKRIILTSFFFILSSVLVFLPLGLYFLENPADFFGRTTQVSVFASEAPLKNLALNTAKTLGMFNFSGDYNWRHNLAGQPQLFWPVGIMFIVGVIIGLRGLFSRYKTPRYTFSDDRQTRYNFLFIWLIVAALPVVISNEGLPHALRAILMIPPVFILSAIGGVAIYDFFVRKVSAKGGSLSVRQAGAFGGKNTLVLKTASFFLLLFILLNSYFTYFVRWAKNPNVSDAFAKNYVEIGRELNELPNDLPKYVIVNAGGVDVRGLPMPAQTVMFLTDTFTPEKQAEKNIHYLLPEERERTNIPPQTFTINLN